VLDIDVLIATKWGEYSVSTTQAQAEVMARTADKFEQVNQQLDAMLNRLMSELDVLKSQWQGAGGRTFDETRREWANDQQRMHRALAETATAIRTAGRDYTAADDEAVSRARSARSGLPLPL
jgi:WXG100 family type VII secretion target